MPQIMVRDLNNFKDIFEPRRNGTSNFMYMSRSLNNIVSPFYQRKKLTPTQLKNEVLNSKTIKYLIDVLSKQYDIDENYLRQQIKLLLDEIGFNKNYNVIRWFGLLLIKICLKVCSGIFVNETAILNLRSRMGKVPIVYIPSHRSYADFILMSYICFTYDIEIPAIAAGMDFHAMWGMGKLLRDTGAFFMRRSFNGDKLYWETFQEYVFTVIAKSEQGIEFFIEGTRSRSGKSLVPKTGLLSMILKPYFKSEVPDILFVPINFSYDRVLEEQLFAFELFGVPKPKESTSGFVKSLSLMNENYGSIYVDLGAPISANEYFYDKTDKILHNMRPKHVNFVTKNEKLAMQMLANEIVHSQQKLCTIHTFNLIALVLMNDLTSQTNSLFLSDLINEVIWLKSVLEKFGALIALKDVNIDIHNSLITHKNLVQIDDENKLCLIQNKILLGNNITKLKGHLLSENTMTMAIPYVMLQIYVNPTLHYFINSSILLLILTRNENVNRAALRKHFQFVRYLYAKEFVFAEYLEENEFNETLSTMFNFNLITETNSVFTKGENTKLIEFLIKLLDPYLLSYYVVLKYLNQIDVSCNETDMLVWCQSTLEQALTNNIIFIHPYSLCLDTLSNCLQSYNAIGILSKTKNESGIIYNLNTNYLYEMTLKFETYLPAIYIDNFNLLIKLRNKL